MSWIEEISKCRSLSIVGLEKNTGKTECLNYILRELKGSGKTIALTSIGIDGEQIDQVCQTVKPEIKIYEGMLFVTSERHFRQKCLVAEILSVTEERTALGRLVTARAVTEGKVLLSGPPYTAGMKKLITAMEGRGVDLTIVDGALSRLSHGSPAVSEGLVLATGAAVSANIPQLVRRTKYIYDLISLEAAGPGMEGLLESVENGIWAVDEKEKIWDLHIPSAFMLGKNTEDMFRFGHRLYVAGAVSDKLLNTLRVQKEAVELIVQDFTRVFALPETFYAFLRKGGKIRVLRRTRLLGVCINPQSPSGFCLNTARLQEALKKSLGIPVYDVREMRQ